MKKTVAVIVGTRPEAIKMAPVWFALEQSAILQPLLISTGQHREMLNQTLRVFGLKPDIDLALMKPGQTLPDLTARVLTSMTAVLREHRPAAILVQGDTTTVLGAALAAFYERIPVGHVEAGLRTYDYNAPWPEEMNRRVADPLSRWCFAPTEWSASNLRAERISSENIHVTGNTVVDALLWVRNRQQQTTTDQEVYARRCGIPEAFAKRFFTPSSEFESADLQIHRFAGPVARWILVTGHRRESFGEGFENICRAIAKIIKEHPEVGVLYPVHLNPNVQEPVRRLLGSEPRIALVPPMAYENFIWFMNRCHFVLSDSGGVQEEAPSLGKPVLVMRDTTERPEGIQAGTCRLVGTDPGTISREAAQLLNDFAAYAHRSALRNPYGDGTAARRIVEVLERDL